VIVRLAEHFDLARERRLQPDDRAHQHRFAGARPADHAQDLAAADVEVEMSWTTCSPKLFLRPWTRMITFVGPLSARSDARRRRHHIQPIEEKNTANNASSTMTRKIACDDRGGRAIADLLGIAAPACPGSIR
jgi:hypothetical protein